MHTETVGEEEGEKNNRREGMKPPGIVPETLKSITDRALRLLLLLLQLIFLFTIEFAIRRSDHRHSSGLLASNCMKGKSKERSSQQNDHEKGQIFHFGTIIAAYGMTACNNKHSKKKIYDHKNTLKEGSSSRDNGEGRLAC